MNFQVCSYQAVEGGRSYRMFDMTRDGFALLAMGFTGAKALHFKLRYIEQYNRMEEELKTRAQMTPAIPTTFVEALRLAADEAEKRMVAEAQVKALIEPAAVGLLVQGRKGRIHNRTRGIIATF